MRRFFAFIVDSIIITLITIVIFFGGSELIAVVKGERGYISKTIEAIKKGEPFLISSDSDEEIERNLEKVYRRMLQKKLPPGEYEQSKKMSLHEIKSTYSDTVDFEMIEKRIVKVSEGIELLKEIVVAYMYFIFFFRFGAQTPGKRNRRRRRDLYGMSRRACAQRYLLGRARHVPRCYDNQLHESDPVRRRCHTSDKRSEHHQFLELHAGRSGPHDGAKAWFGGQHCL